MTMRENSSANTGAEAEAEPAVKEQQWWLLDDGAQVYAADGEQIGSVRQSTPRYLEVRAKGNLLADVEMYVPRDLIDRVEGDRVYLTRSNAELEEMDLKTPPALKE